MAHIIVNCRIGSLEMAYLCAKLYRDVNCRIGSLEKIGDLTDWHGQS